MTNEFESPGFIVGVERSGTTLLSAIINRHSQVCVLPETKFFIFLYGYRGGLKGFKKDWPASLDSVVQKMIPTPDWQPSSQEILKRFNNVARAPEISEIFRALGNSVRENRNKKLWLEKTPNHIKYINQIRDFFPNSPIVHIIRDGRDVAESLSGMHWQRGSYFNSLMVWKDLIQRAETFLLTDKKVKTIKYEKLVCDTDNTVRAICKFLEIEYQQRMLLPDGSESNLIEIGMKHKELVKEPITPKKIQNWQKVLPVENQQLATMILKDHLKKWNYETYPATSRQVIRLWTSIGLHNRAQASGYDQLLLQLFRNKNEIKITGIFSVNEKLPEQNADMYVLTRAAREYPDDLARFLRMSTFLLSVILNFFRLKFRKIPVLWIYHSDSDSIWKSRFEKYIEWVFALFSDCIVCPCNQEDCNFAEALPKHTSKVIHIDGKFYKNLQNRLKLGDSCCL